MDGWTKNAIKFVLFVQPNMKGHMKKRKEGKPEKQKRRNYMNGHIPEKHNEEKPNNKPETHKRQQGAKRS